MVVNPITAANVFALKANTSLSGSPSRASELQLRPSES
jgi:hypothetical protein